LTLDFHQVLGTLVRSQGRGMFVSKGLDQEFRVPGAQYSVFQGRAYDTLSMASVTSTTLSTFGTNYPQNSLVFLPLEHQRRPLECRN
jgi:hypothetical protein